MQRHSGPERRVHRLFVTQNTEYHLRGRECVAIRNVWSGEWAGEHPALGKRLFGAVMPSDQGLEPLSEPSPGCLLWFENGENDILTSRVNTVTRPPKTALRHYRVGRC